MTRGVTSHGINAHSLRIQEGLTLLYPVPTGMTRSKSRGFDRLLLFHFCIECENAVT